MGYDYYEVVHQLQSLNEKCSSILIKLDSVLDGQTSNLTFLSQWRELWNNVFHGVDFKRVVFCVSLIAFMIFCDRFIRRGWLNG